MQWYDGTLAKAVLDLERNPLLEAAGLRYDIGPDGRSVQDAYEIGDQDAQPPVFAANPPRSHRPLPAQARPPRR